MANKLNSGDILTEEQLTHNLKIYAGPGAGKTHFLVENVKNIIAKNEIITQGKARKVLCITYTNAAVNEIIRRLDGFLDYVEVYTIHSFIIEHIIKPFQQELMDLMKSDFDIDIDRKGKITSQVEGLGLLHGVNKEELFKFVRESDVRNAKDEISYSKKIMSEVEVDNLLFIESLKKGESIFSIKHSDKIKETHVIPIKQYIWSKVRRLTHNEILFFGYRILQINPLALYSIRVKFPFIFVDEFQDTNPIQTILIRLLGENGCKISIVGDIAQSIYSFQGAKPTDFLSFCVKKDADLEFSILGNRRSTLNIVNFCNFLRQSDISVCQEALRAQEEIGNAKIHFLLGNSNNIKVLINEIMSQGGVVITRAWAAAFNYIQNIETSQISVLKNMYNSYYNSPIQIRDEIVEHNNVTWVRAFRFIFNLKKSYDQGSLIDMIKALHLYGDINLRMITPETIFQLDKLTKLTFNGVADNCFTCAIIEKFNMLIQGEEYIRLKELLGVEDFKIPIFDDLEKDKLKTAVEQLQWGTSLKLFQEVFAEDSKYMTVHQAKGLEWDKVIVSVSPNRFDGIKINQVFSNPQLMKETYSEEFIRMYYVACSRAKKDLYVHIESGCTKEEINVGLMGFIERTGMQIEYEFIE